MHHSGGLWVSFCWQYHRVGQPRPSPTRDWRRSILEWVRRKIVCSIVPSLSRRYTNTGLVCPYLKAGLTVEFSCTLFRKVYVAFCGKFCPTDKRMTVLIRTGALKKIWLSDEARKSSKRSADSLGWPWTTENSPGRIHMTNRVIQGSSATSPDSCHDP